MTSRRDMRPANWARTVARLRRYMAELETYGVKVIEPFDFDTPPERRIANTSNVVHTEPTAVGL